MNEAAYTKTVNKLREVVAGTRGFVCLTHAAREIGISKLQLAVAAKGLGLEVANKHGRYGMCAYRPAAQVALDAAGAMHRRYSAIERELETLRYGTEHGVDTNAAAICELEIELEGLRTRIQAEG